MVSLEAAKRYVQAHPVAELGVRRNPLLYGRAVRELRSVEAMGEDERRAWTDARLMTTLRRASRTPYGRRVGAGAHVADWPLLTKETLRDDPGSLHAPGRFPTLKASTGGTTGVPLHLVRSLTSVVVEQACIDVLSRRLVPDPRVARIATLRGDDVGSLDDTETPFWRRTTGGRRLILSSNHLSRATVTDYVAVLRDFAPDLLWTMPTSLRALCSVMDLEGLELKIPGVLCSSETLRPEVRALAERVLGCRLVDYYGQAERVAMACSVPGGYTFFPGYSFVELVPAPQPNSMAGEGTVWEIVGTSLWNAAMPMVRYRTGDLVHLPDEVGDREREEIALGLRPFPAVTGRGDDVLYAPDPPRVLTGTATVYRGVPHIRQLQFVQPAVDRVILKVVPGPRFGPAEAAMLEANARRKIPRTVSLEVAVGDSLTRTAAGKTPFVVRSEVVNQAIAAARARHDGPWRGEQGGSA